MKAPDGYVLLRGNLTPDEAAVMAEVLDAVNISSFVPGLALNDDFASMKLMRTHRFTEIWVPEKDRVRAEASLDDARSAGEDLDSESDTLAGS